LYDATPSAAIFSSCTYCEVTIGSSTFENHHGTNGSAVYVDGGTINIYNSMFGSNVATNTAAALYISEQIVNSTINIVNSVFSNNTAHGTYSTGGDYLIDFSSPIKTYISHSLYLGAVEIKSNDTDLFLAESTFKLNKV